MTADYKKDLSERNIPPLSEDFIKSGKEKGISPLKTALIGGALAIAAIKPLFLMKRNEN